MRNLWFVLFAGCAAAPEAGLPEDALAPPLAVSLPADVYPGVPFDVTIAGAVPLSTVAVAASQSAYTVGYCPPALGGACLDLDAPHLVAQGRADAAGDANLRVTAPAMLPVGTVFYLQVASIAGPASLVGTVQARELYDPRCPGVLRAFGQETAAVRACAVPSDCGQILQGTSCGCTRNWVANNNASTARFYQLLDIGSMNCGLALMSTCDCPQTYGFDCVNQTCQWDFTP